HVAPCPIQALQLLQQRRNPSLCNRTVLILWHEHADAPHPLALLRPRRDWIRCCRAAENREELAPPHHSITSSARLSSGGGTVSSSAWAVTRLTTRSNFVGCSTGRSAGFAPRRILST